MDATRACISAPAIRDYNLASVEPPRFELGTGISPAPRGRIERAKSRGGTYQIWFGFGGAAVVRWCESARRVADGGAGVGGVGVGVRDSGPRGTCSVLSSRVEMQSDGPMSLVYKKAAKEASTICMDRVLRSYVRDGSMYSRFDVWRRPDRNAFVDSGARGSGCAVAVDAGAGCWEPGIASGLARNF